MSPLFPIDNELFFRCLHFRLNDGNRLVNLEKEIVELSPDRSRLCGDRGLDVGRSESVVNRLPTSYSIETVLPCLEYEPRSSTPLMRRGEGKRALSGTWRVCDDIPELLNSSDNRGIRQS